MTQHLPLRENSEATEGNIESGVVGELDKAAVSGWQEMGQKVNFYAATFNLQKSGQRLGGGCMLVQAFPNVGRLDFEIANYTTGYVKAGFVCLEFFIGLS